MTDEERKYLREKFSSRINPERQNTLVVPLFYKEAVHILELLRQDDEIRKQVEANT